MRKAEIIPIEPETVSTVEGKCITFFVELKKHWMKFIWIVFFELFKTKSNLVLLTPYASIFNNKGKGVFLWKSLNGHYLM